jgi:hypothetical protein
MGIHREDEQGVHCLVDGGLGVDRSYSPAPAPSIWAGRAWHPRCAVACICQARGGVHKCMRRLCLHGADGMTRWGARVMVCWHGSLCGVIAHRDLAGVVRIGLSLCVQRGAGRFVAVAASARRQKHAAIRGVARYYVQAQAMSISWRDTARGMPTTGTWCGTCEWCEHGTACG